MEEAVIQTTSLPAGLQIKAGKFFSDFGRMNAQHSHQWDFVDQPLVYKLLFGDHGLNEKGAQLSWLAPTRHHLLFGVEALQGENELLANNIGGDHLPRREGPRLWGEWVKFSPNLGNEHGLQLGTFYGHGAHQEAHDADDNGVMDHWLNGHSGFWGASAVYKYDVAKPHGEGDILLQTEYVMRKKNLTVKDHDLSPAMIGRDRTDQQDGFYAQGLYGFLPRWRAGVRWDHVGLTNKGELPDGTVERFGDSARYAAMIDFSPTEFSRLRLQVSKGDYATSDGREDVVEVFLQFVISLGTHGAHKF